MYYKISIVIVTVLGFILFFSPQIATLFPNSITMSDNFPTYCLSVLGVGGISLMAYAPKRRKTNK
jgi:hypothetical protein